MIFSKLIDIKKVIQIKYHLSFFTKLGQQLYYYQNKINQTTNSLKKKHQKIPPKNITKNTITPSLV